MTVLVLGDQLTSEYGPLARHPDERVLMVEAHGFARRKPYHPHKLTLVFSAMRHFRDRLREAGRTVEYRRAETFRAALAEHLADHPGDDLVVMRPASHGAGERLRDHVEDHGGRLKLVENETFLTSREDWDRFTDDRDPPYRHEAFYQFVRRETGYLMADGTPVGGDWNYDEENRAFPGSDYDPPDPARYDPDSTTREVREWVRQEFQGTYNTDPPGGAWADPGEFIWPVTRQEALDALDRFVDERLPAFGPYQDAMLDDEWAMNHSLLSTSLNLALLHPSEVAEHAIDAAKADPDVPLNSVEGFVRQVIGWREFTRHVYRETMPELVNANQLNQHKDLPEFYWTGDTDMACLSDVVDSVRERGYSHHIERLMVLSNFALLYGVEPRQLNKWFHAAYVDAYHWVTTPNVIEMGSYGAGVFATKPYASSANYIDRMSDYCTDCPYAKTKDTGANACPFNSLYWDFLARNEEELRSNHRMGLMYSHVDNKRGPELDAIRERAEEVRDLAADDEL